MGVEILAAEKRYRPSLLSPIECHCYSSLLARLEILSQGIRAEYARLCRALVPRANFSRKLREPLCATKREVHRREFAVLLSRKTRTTDRPGKPRSDSHFSRSSLAYSPSPSFFFSFATSAPLKFHSERADRRKYTRSDEYGVIAMTTENLSSKQYNRLGGSGGGGGGILRRRDAFARSNGNPIATLGRRQLPRSRGG